jgi:hypothetical protein
MVSHRLREDFGNGEEFYARSGQQIAVPERKPDRPHRIFLEWLRDRVARVADGCDKPAYQERGRHVVCIDVVGGSIGRRNGEDLAVGVSSLIVDGGGAGVAGNEAQAARHHWIYHFTHLDNMGEIRRTGRLVCDVAARQGHMRREVGDLSIKESRRRRVLPLPPGGRVGDYVPFYYAPRSPMMFRIACDHRDGVAGRYPDGDRPLVYLVSSVETIVAAGLTWLATDGNAATATTEFTADVGRLHEMVDWPLMLAERWNSSEDDPDRQRRRMAEFLVHQQVPLSAIRWLATYGEAQALSLRETLGDHELTERIVVRPTWYYGYEQRRGGVR